MELLIVGILAVLIGNLLSDFIVAGYVTIQARRARAEQERQLAQWQESILDGADRNTPGYN